MDYNETFEFSTGLILFWIALVIFYLYVSWKIFEKAGRPGWEAIIPLYSAYILLKIVGKPGWWLLLYLIPFVNIVFAIWTVNMLSKSFGKDEGFTIGLIVLSFIFYPILAFGSAKYLGPYGDPVAFRALQEERLFDFEKKS
jgi:hypothetical protein